MIVSHGFPPSELGGTELYSYHLAKSLSEKGTEVSVFTRMTKSFSARDVSPEGYVCERTEGVRIFRSLDSTSSMREFVNPYVARTFRSVLMREGPDLVHFQHLIFLSADLPRISASCGIPSLMTFHDYWFLCPRVQLLDAENGLCPGPAGGVSCTPCFDTPRFNEYRFFNRLKRLVPDRSRSMVKRWKQSLDNRRVPYSVKAMEFHTRLAFLKNQFDLFEYRISPSRYLIERYEREGFGGICYLPLGLPPVPRVDFCPAKPLRLGYIGSINSPKGLAVAIRELAGLLRSGALRLIVFGQPHDRSYLSRIRTELKTVPSGAYEFCGTYRSDFESLRKIFLSFDVFIFPSVWEENSPLVVREALLAGKPVIASRLGGVPEVVHDEVNGLLFDPFEKGDLEEKVRRVLEDPVLLCRLAKGAGETEVQTLEEHADRVLRLYGEALNRKRAVSVKECS